MHEINVSVIEWHDSTSSRCICWEDWRTFISARKERSCSSDRQCMSIDSVLTLIESYCTILFVIDVKVVRQHPSSFMQ